MGDTVILDSRAIWRCRKISRDTANGKRNKSKPFERADGEPLDVTGGDGKGENLRAFIGHDQIDIDHVSIADVVQISVVLVLVATQL